MSLLMDALNKAEQAKRQSQAVDSRPDGGDRLEPVSPPLTLELLPESPPADPVVAEPPPPALPELPSHLGALDEEFIAHVSAPKPTLHEKKPPVVEARPTQVLTPKTAPEQKPAAKPAPAPARKDDANDAMEREAAQNLFDAKQPGNPPSRRKLVIAMSALTLLAGVGIGGYVWMEMQPKSGLGAAMSLANAPRQPLQPLQPLQPQPAAPAAPANAAQPPAAAPTVTPPVKPLPAAATPPRPSPTDNASGDPAEASRPIRLSSSKITMNPTLARAYDAYMAGNLAEAQSEYEQVLKGEAANLDALHGLAAISLRQRRVAAAEEYYLRAIEVDPRDALAHAGLIGLRGNVDPIQAESRLKTLLATQPDTPMLNFALGNLYAGQSRWNDAQSAYFKAYGGDPENPDILFNLAISLDRLHQPKLAQRYYNLALAAAANRPSNFDKAQLAIRLRELQ